MSQDKTKSNKRKKVEEEPKDRHINVFNPVFYKVKAILFYTTKFCVINPRKTCSGGPSLLEIWIPLCMSPYRSRHSGVTSVPCLVFAVTSAHPMNRFMEPG